MKEKKVKFDLVQDEIGAYWPVSLFMEAYKHENNLTGCIAATLSLDFGNPGKTALVFLRTCIENSERLKKGKNQKYVLVLKFYNFGDLATLDVISLDKSFHRDIAYEHLGKMGWPLSKSGSVSRFKETIQSPFIFVGGFLDINNEGVVRFFGKSGDYGNKISSTESHLICKHVAYACGLRKEGDLAGEIFINNLLEFMLKFKRKSDFYERFYQDILTNAPSLDQVLTTQQLGALMMMKVADRTIGEEGDGLQIMTEEMVDGFGKFVTVAGVAEHIKRSRSN